MVDPDGQAVYGRQNEDGTMSYIVGENGDITAEGYTWIDDSYDCMDENGNYKQLPGGQSAQSSQTAQSTQPAPLAIENSNANKPIEQNGGYLMTGGMNSTCGLGSKSREVYGIIDCTEFATSVGGGGALRNTNRLFSLIDMLDFWGGSVFRADNIIDASSSVYNGGAYEYNNEEHAGEFTRIIKYAYPCIAGNRIPGDNGKFYYAGDTMSITNVNVTVQKSTGKWLKQDTLPITIFPAKH